MKIARGVTKTKPVLVFKSWKDKEGARASASHTGAMAVDDKIFDGLCRHQAFSDLRVQGSFEIPKMFASQALPKGGRLWHRHSHRRGRGGDH